MQGRCCIYSEAVGYALMGGTVWDYIKLSRSYRVGDIISIRLNIIDHDLYGRIIPALITVVAPFEGGQLHTVELTPTSSRRYGGHTQLVVEESLIKLMYPNQDYWDEMAWEG